MAVPPDDRQSAGLQQAAVADADDQVQPAPPRAASNEAEASDQPQVGRGRFLRPLTDSEISQIRKLVAETGRPEEITALSWSKPDKSIGHRLYLPAIDVRRALRTGGEMVPCSFCSHGHPKALNLFLLWSADGHLRLVGRKCGPNHFGHAEYRELEKAARAANLKKANIDLLLDHLGSAHLWRQEAVALLEACKRFESIRRPFLKRVPTLHQRLRYEVKEHQNALMVYVPANKSTPAGFRSSVTGEQSAMEPRIVAVLQGAEFLMPAYDATAKAAAIIDAIDTLTWPYKGGALNDDQVLALVDYKSESALAAAASELRAAHGGARKLLDWLQRARMFLTDANIDALDTWSSHEKNDFSLKVVRVPGGVVYRCRAEYVRLPLAEDVAIPDMAHLGALRA